MGTTAEKLNYLLETKNAIKDALNNKGFKVSEKDTFRSYADVINGISAEDKDVRLFDYYGNIVFSYTKEEFAALSELPPTPNNKLYAAVWDKTLSQAQRALELYGFVDIGEVSSEGDYYPYTSENFYLQIEVSDELSKTVRFKITNRSSPTIDWGDGTVETYEGIDSSIDYYYTVEHTYNSYGKYTVVVGARKIRIGEDSPDFAVTNIISTFYSYVGYLTETYLKHCNRLQSVSINGATEVSFSHCPQLKHFIVKDVYDAFYFSDCPALRSCISNKLLELGPNCLQLSRLSGLFRGSTVIQNPSNNISLRKITLRADYALPSKYFSNCFSLHSIKIDTRTSEYKPIQLHSSSSNAFENCYALESIELGSGIIPTEAFLNCVSLKQLNTTVPITAIYKNAFKGCSSLESLSIENCTILDEGAFESSGIKSCVIPTTVGTISDRLFANTALNTIELHNSLNEIGASAFENTALKTFDMPDSVSTVGARAFLGSEIVEFHFGSGLQAISERMLSLTPIVSINIPGTIKDIGASAFRGCAKLTSVILNEGIQSIQSYAFAGAPSLELFDCRNLTSIPTLGRSAFYLLDDLVVKIVVPDSLYDTWIVTEGWATYSNHIIKASEYTE